MKMFSGPKWRWIILPVFFSPIVLLIVVYFYVGFPFGYESRCPDPFGMVYIPAGPFWFRYEGDRWRMEGLSDHQIEMDAYCIDRFEFPNAWLRKPMTSVTWHEAETICRLSGKGLCTGPEWQKAFGGPEGLRFPYGNEFDQNRCNTYYIKDGKEFARKIAKTGSFWRCVSPYGVYDMSGNVSDWTEELWQTGFEEHVLRGGSFNINRENLLKLLPNGMWQAIDYSNSIGAIHHHPPDTRSGDDGFRCCADPVKNDTRLK